MSIPVDDVLNDLSDNNEEEEDGPDISYEYPPPPNDRYSLPPEELLAKMRSVRQYLREQENDELSLPFGMMDRPIFTLKGYPSSLFFDDTLPSDDAVQAIHVIHERLLSIPTFGIKQGCYGACGGGVHIMYLDGRDRCDDDIETLLDLTHPSSQYQSSQMKWMLTVDPLHQHLFPKKRSDFIDEWQHEKTVLSLDDTSTILLEYLDTAPFLDESSIPQHVVENYPMLSHGRILFLLPRFSAVHDGDCLQPESNGTCLCPMAAAFARRSNRDEYWSQFLRRRDNNDTVIWQETALGTAKEPGDVFQSPVFAIFQLRSTRELLALVQWDYRD